MLDFRVYTFLEVCKYMNFTKAAEALHITQPAVSQHIRFIEDYYQTRLFPSRARSRYSQRPGNICSMPFRP